MPPQTIRGEIEFHDVDFRYPGGEEDVLHDISFKAQPGQITAVIGSTGSGKSTLVNLLPPRLFDVSKGKITLDGIDIRDLTQHDLREQISYAPQRGGLLFSGTVKSNLSVGKHDATEEEMRHAIEVAQVADFVLGDKDGLDMEIAQAGTNLSGGQKQRLSIARALMKDSPVYILMTVSRRSTLRPTPLYARRLNRKLLIKRFLWSHKEWQPRVIRTRFWCSTMAGWSAWDITTI